MSTHRWGSGEQNKQNKKLQRSPARSLIADESSVARGSHIPRCGLCMNTASHRAACTRDLRGFPHTHCATTRLGLHHPTHPHNPASRAANSACRGIESHHSTVNNCVAHHDAAAAHMHGRAGRLCRHCRARRRRSQWYSCRALPPRCRKSRRRRKCGGCAGADRTTAAASTTTGSTSTGCCASAAWGCVAATRTAR